MADFTPQSKKKNTVEKLAKFVAPMRNGITASTVFLPASLIYASVYDFLCHTFSHISATIWQQRFAQQLIFTQSGQILSIDSPYLAQQHIYYYRELPFEVPVPFQHRVLFEHRHFLVVDKPPFLTVSPTGQYVQQTLLTRLKKQYNDPNISPIHRLDRETAGLILFSRQPASRGQYQRLFAQQRIHKIYHAIAPYHPSLHFPIDISLRLEKGQPFYTMQVVAGLPNSHTHIQLLTQQDNWAKYQLTPSTGKQHQLRVHMAHLGLPLKNDPLYPQIKHRAADDFSQPLQLLAKYLSFTDPMSGEDFEFCSQFELSL